MEIKEYPTWVEYKELEKIMKELENVEKKNKKSIEGKNKKVDDLGNKEENYKDYYDDYWDYMRDNFKKIKQSDPPKPKNINNTIEKSINYINELYKQIEMLRK